MENEEKKQPFQATNCVRCTWFWRHKCPEETMEYNIFKAAKHMPCDLFQKETAILHGEGFPVKAYIEKQRAKGELI